MTLDPATRQHLLELAYDLLPEAEAADWRRRIDAEPELARAFADAQETAGLFSEAARVRVPKITLQRSLASKTPAGSAKHPISSQADRAGTPWARAANWVVGLAAAGLLAVSLGGYYYHHKQIERIRAQHVRLTVTCPPKLQSAAETKFGITTRSITGDPLSAEVTFALHPSDGGDPFIENQETDEQGQLEIAVPVGFSAGFKANSTARLEVLAVHQKIEERVVGRMAVEPIRHVTHLSLDKPLYRPGETAYYRSLTLARLSLEPEESAPIEFEILDPQGAMVPNSQVSGITEHGVGNGSFTIPGGDEIPGGKYTLVAHSPQGAFPDQRRSFFVRRYRLPKLNMELEFLRDSYTSGDLVEADFLVRRRTGPAAASAPLLAVADVDGREVFRGEPSTDENGAARIEFSLPENIRRGDAHLAVCVDAGDVKETFVKTIPINLGRVDVDFYPEGGDLAAGLENRVYFVGRDPIGEPVHLQGVVLDQNGHAVAAVETMHEGMGAFSFVPEAGHRYRLKIIKPTGVAEEPPLPRLVARRNVVLTTGIGVFASDQPLECHIRAAEQDVPLVVSATCRGVPIGQQALITRHEIRPEGGQLEVLSRDNPVVIPLADDIGGVIRLTVHDYSVSPPEPVAERLMYRRMPRRLDVRAQQDGRQYTPGQRVNMSVQVTDERGDPVSAVLGVAVVDKTVLGLSPEHAPRMPTHFLLTTEIEKPEDLEEADFYLSDDPEAPVALDLLLGTQGWRRFVEETLEEGGRDKDADHEQFAQLIALGGAGGPPSVFDNLKQIQSKYTENLSDYRQTRTRTLRTVTTTSFFAGLGLMLLVAMLGLLRVVTGVHLWVPAVGVTTCCLLIGALLMDPGLLRANGDRVVAFLPFHVEPPTDAPRDGAKQKDKTADGVLEDADGVLEDATDPAKERPDADERDEPTDELLALDRGWQRGQRELLLRKLQATDLGEKALEQIEGLEEERLLNERAKLLEGLPGDGRQLGRRLLVRKYAHQRRSTLEEARSDFAETLYWNPLTLTDAKGRAAFSFDLSDSLTTFELRADAHGSDRIGTGTAEIVSRIPFSLDPKLPPQVNVGDRIELPLAVVNNTPERLSVELELIATRGTQTSPTNETAQKADGLIRIEDSPRRVLKLNAQQRTREYFPLSVIGAGDDCTLTFHGTAGRLSDRVSYPLKIVPPGFPREVSYAGQIDGRRHIAVDLPEQTVDGSLEVTLTAFPSMLADLQHGLDGILREPVGCFEQASTANYPNVLSLQYMREQDVADPAVVRRAKRLLTEGYEKLVGYECRRPRQGYEWFGQSPAHEALTAYGLMEFRDMAEVHDVDPEMLERTAEWLMKRRDGKGGFLRNPKTLDSFGGAPDDITNAYITWALSESGQEGIEREIEHVVRSAEASEDPYVIALAAATAANAQDNDAARKLLAKLSEAQADDGHLQGRRCSITQSGGQSLAMETTALATLAWLKLPDYAAEAGRAVGWITAHRQGAGGFGSTQATILALKALIEHAKTHPKPLTSGKLIIGRDDQIIGEHAFTAGRQEVIEIDGLEAQLRAGRNNVTIELTGDNKMPYCLAVRYRTLQGESHPSCPVRLSTTLAERRIEAGETVSLTTKITNVVGGDQPMTIAIVGLPAGLEARIEQLEELKKAGTIDFYETRGRELIFYWRTMKAGRSLSMRLDLIAAIPGHYTGPASRCYLYYTPEQKHWSAPLSIDILP